VASGPAAERYSTLRALKAVDRADVAVLVIDAFDGLTAQDAHVAGFIAEEGRGLVLALNKWDLLEEKTGRTFDEYTTAIRADVPFLDFAPIVSISAKTGQRVGKVLELAVDVWGERRKRISTPELNRVMRAAAVRQPPPAGKLGPPKIFYATQVAVAPPTFVFFARHANQVHFSYQRFLENQLRAEFGFDGTPIRLVFRERAGGRSDPAGTRGRGGARSPGRGPVRGAGQPRPVGPTPSGPRPGSPSGGADSTSGAPSARPASGGRPVPGNKPARGVAGSVKRPTGRRGRPV
jgi:GTP-binding protein